LSGEGHSQTPPPPLGGGYPLPTPYPLDAIGGSVPLLCLLVPLQLAVASDAAEKWWKIIKFSVCTAKLTQTLPINIFWPIVDCLACIVPRCDHFKVLFYAELVGVRGHFRSRDKDGSHTNRSAVAENPCYTQTPYLYLL